MMCTTVLHGGVCHRTSTPQKSGNKMKEKKNKVGGILGFAIFRNRQNALGTSRMPPPYHNAPNIIAHMSTVLNTAIAQEWAVWGSGGRVD